MVYATIGSGVMALLLINCSAPDQHPFEQYSAAVKKADVSLGAALDQGTSWSRDDYIRSVLEGRIMLSHSAVLQEKRQFAVSFPDSSGGEPIFHQLQDCRVKLLNASAASEKYIDLLVKLAGKDLINADTFQAIATDTDASLNSIAKTLQLKVGTQAIPIFATASSEAMRLLIEHRRRAALVTVLKNNQSAIDAYSALCVALVNALDHSVSEDYRRKAIALVDSFDDIKKQARSSASSTDEAQRSGPTPTPDKQSSQVNLVNNEEAKTVVEQLLQLDADYLALVASLKSATQIYQKLPDGHRELLKSVQKQSTAFAAIKDIAEEGERLKSIYDALQKSDASKPQNKTKQS
jgi:hypothetical protein